MPRPKLYTPEEIQKKWWAYIEYCEGYTRQHPTSSGKVVETRHPRVPTVGGFARFLKIDPETLLNYEKDGEYFGTVKGIKKFIELWKSDALVNGEGDKTGIIFDLKANYGWKETQVQEVKGQITGFDFVVKNGGKGKT